MFHQQKGLIGEKERVATSCRHSNPYAHSRLLARTGDGGVFMEGERKFREGEFRTIELCYKHRVPPVGFSGLRRAGGLPEALAPG